MEEEDKSGDNKDACLERYGDVDSQGSSSSSSSSSSTGSSSSTVHSLIAQQTKHC